MATDYSKYNQSQYDNQKAYLEGLQNSGSAGQAAWAKNELASLNSQYSGGSNNPGNSSYKQAGNVNNGDNKYGNSYIYDGSNSYVSTDGGKNYTNQATGETKQETGQSKYGQTSGWNSYNGATGKQYEVAGSNGTILVTRPDGSYDRVLPTDENYNATYQAMLKDLQGAGVNYTPSHTYGVDADLDGQKEYYTTKDYLQGNAALQDAFTQYGKTNPGASLDDYIASIYNGIGTNGMTLQGAADELTRLGLDDYLPGNAIYTASGKLIPVNEFTSFEDGSSGTTNGADSRWVNYGGRDYLIGGDDSNYVNYVNALTGNYDILDYIFGGVDMAKNPYAQQDPEFMAQFNKDLANLYANAGIQMPATGNTGTGGSYTGYDKVDKFIDYANSFNNYNQATGGTGGDIWSEIKAMLDGGYEAQQAFIESQRTRAEQDAEDLMRQAYVTNKLQGDSVKEAMSAAGLGTTGAMQSAMLGVQNNYNSNVADIRSNLNQLISSFSEQELQALTDYMNRSTDYYYQVQNDMQDRAYQNAQLYMKQAEMQQAQEQQKWENLYKQQLLDIDKQQYKDSQDHYADETEYARKQDEAEYYRQLYNAKAITASQYQQALRNLGFVV